MVSDIDTCNAPGGGYSDDPVLVAELRKAGLGRPPGNNRQFQARRHRYWSRRDYAAAGQAQLKFFNEAQASGVNNLESSNIIPNGHIFIVKSLGIEVIGGINRAGSITGGKAQFSGTTFDPLVMAEELRHIYKMGWVQFVIGNTTILDQQLDLTAFPLGRGLVFDTAIATGNAEKAAAAFCSNGAPVSRSRFNFPGGGEWIRGGQGFRLEINWVAVQALTGGGLVHCELEGILAHSATG